MPYTVANVLEQEAEAAIAEWLMRVSQEPEILAIALTPEERSAHLPAVFRDLVARLRERLPLGTPALMSDAAFDHGTKRREQGYTPAMMVNESRMLQVSIFEALQKYLPEIDSALLLGNVMTIADECDAQLEQAMSSYLVEAKQDAEPVEAWTPRFASSMQSEKSAAMKRSSANLEK